MLIVCKCINTSPVSLTSLQPLPCSWTKIMKILLFTMSIKKKLINHNWNTNFDKPDSWCTALLHVFTDSLWLPVCLHLITVCGFRRTTDSWICRLSVFLGLILHFYPVLTTAVPLKRIRRLLFKYHTEVIWCNCYFPVHLLSSIQLNHIINSTK